MIGYTPYFERFGTEEEWDTKPVLLPEPESIDQEEEESKRVKFDDTSCGRSAHTCVTDDLFKSGYDDIVYEGELMKFKPGLSQNFVSRYVQISQRAFRYFRN